MEIRTVSRQSIAEAQRLKKIIDEKAAAFSIKSPFLIFAPTDEDGRLGYYDSLQNMIVLSDDFLKESNKGDEEATALHELAHSVDYARRGYSTHDAVFREICRSLGVPEGFDKAKVKLNKQRKNTALRRIDKLIRLSESPFESESTEALKKAQRLMAEYAVTDQETRDEEAVLYTLPLAEKKRFFYYEKVFATIITKLSGAFILREKRKENTVLSAYGTVDQVEFAYETYIFLQDAMNEAYRNASKAYQGETEKLSFAAGLASRLLEKVERESDIGVSKALILSTKSNREAFLKIHSELRIRGKRSLSSFSSRSSFEAGENAAMAIRLPEEKGRIRKIGLKGGC